MTVFGLYYRTHYKLYTHSRNTESNYLENNNTMVVIQHFSLSVIITSCRLLKGGWYQRAVKLFFIIVSGEKGRSER